MDNFLTESNSLPAVTLKEVGDRVEGTILQTRKLEDRDLDGEVRTWPNGDIKHVWVFDLDTGNEQQALWVRGNMVTAIRDASKAANITNLIGAKLVLEHHALGEPKQKGYNAPKLFRAKITAAQPTADDDWI